MVKGLGVLFGMHFKVKKTIQGIQVHSILNSRVYERHSSLIWLKCYSIIISSPDFIQSSISIQVSFNHIQIQIVQDSFKVLFKSDALY